MKRKISSSMIDRDDHFTVTKKVSLIHRVLLSPITKYVVPTVFAVACLMTTIYLSMYFVLKNTVDVWTSTCNVQTSYRIDCFPGRLDVSYDECKQAECCWDDRDEFCFHSIPSRHGYTQKNNAQIYHENEILVPRRATSPFGKRNVESLNLDVETHSDHVELILKIGQEINRKKSNYNAEEGRIENLFYDDKMSARTSVRDKSSEKLLNFLPYDAARKTINLQTDADSKMDVYVNIPEFSVTVTRKNDTSRYLLSTAHGPLIFTENYWEFTLHITNGTLYGLNQLELNGTTNWIYDNENGASKLAFLAIDDNGEGASCYVSHDGPTEIEVLNESNLVVLRGFSSPSEISIRVFPGPTPLDAVKQLTKSLRENGENMDKIDLSNLGLHVCPKYRSKDIDEILTTIIDTMKDKETPWDSYCINQEFNPTLGNLMDSDEISIIDKTIERLAREIDKRTIVPHLGPMIFTNNVLASKLISYSLLLRNSSGNYMGTYENRAVFYPDWKDPKARNESLNSFNDYTKYFNYPKLIFVRDAWPRDDTKDKPIPTNPTFAYMPKVLQGLMTSQTVPYTLTSFSRGKSHYTEHSSYSNNFGSFVNEAIESTAAGVMIRGLWGESGNSSWSALRAAIRVGVASGMVGQLPSPMYACGSGEELGPGANNDELCSRWYGAATAWPYLLSLPSNIPMGNHLSMTSTSYIIKHLKFRASLATYARTILARHHNDGSPILSPASIHYPNDLQARYRSNQFMWGYDILVGVVTLPGVSQVSMWIPGRDPWRHLRGGAKVYPTEKASRSITAVEGHVVTLIRPGSLIPIHEKIGMTTESTIKSGITLVANLACNGTICEADGNIFYGSGVDDGEFLSIRATDRILELGNLSRVKSKACNNDGTNVLQQGTRIMKIIVFDYGEFNVSTDLCKIDTPTIELTFV